MLTREQNEALTRIEGDAPMGKLMREHCWIPAVLSAQLEPDGPPKRVRLVGTDYVAFRDTEGRVGFLDERCPHRNASLVLARNEDCALTCIFHGWRIDVTGQVIAAPTHSPNPEAFAAKIKTRRYPVVEGGGLVWVYLGDGEAPPFPHLPFTVLPDSHVWVTATKCACNWLQGVEATLDSSHIGTLHRAYMTAYSQADAGSSIGNSLDALAPRYDVEGTSYGIDAIASRPLTDGSRYVRTTKYVMPFVSLVPSAPGGSDGDVDGVIFIVSPVDDTNHVLFFGFWSASREINDGKYERVPPAQQPIVGDRPFDRDDFGGFSGGREDNWGQDREAMKRGHFSGFTGNLIQEDTVTQVSMGPIVDRTKEHLSSSDVAIIHARRMLLQALDRVAAGSTPMRGAPPTDHLDVIPTDVVIPPSSPVLDSSGSR
jgi:phenylpropionate dioxygenase-like ring-hydroxylating dioxygenase large terminal subunit